MTAAPAPGPALTRLAALFGIATSYRSASGETVEVSRESVAALLALFGAPVRSESAANAAIALERARRHAETLTPVLVHRGEGRPVVEFTPRRALGGGKAELIVTPEGGESRSYCLDDLEAPPTRARRRGVLLPQALPVGVHRIALVAPGFSEEATLLVAPRTLPRARRGWGIFTPTYALRGEHDTGSGTLAELTTLAELVARRGASFVATLPLYALRESPELETSPYLPISRLAWNGLYLDLAPLVAEARDEVVAREWAALGASTASGDPTRLRYRETLARRAPLIARLSALAASERATRDAIESFYRERPLLAEYCAFRARNDLPETPPVAAGELERLAYHRFVQFALDRQLARVAGGSAGLLLDLPIGVHPEGFDTVAFSSSFTFGASVGAPPDPFQAAGQDWAFPPPSPAGQRTDGYRYLRACLRAAFSYASVLRIDHVMAFERLWWIPAGASATEGAYVAAPTEELHALVAIEASRAGAVVVGEDLGTVSATTERAMDDQEMLHSAVLQFSLRPDAPLPEPPARAVASIGTHDLPRFATFWRGEELAAGDLEAHTARAAVRERVVGELGLPGEGELTDDATTAAALAGLVEHLGHSPADLVFVDLEDTWLETEPINRPGTDDGDNWSHRCRYRLDELAEEPRLGALLGALEQARERP